MHIPFTRPRVSANELAYIKDTLASGLVWGGGANSRWCTNWLETHTKTRKALLTQSATDALELAALLLDIKPGDEVIMPSYTFVSTANAFILRGAKVVFVDIDLETQNINPEAIRLAISPSTKAIVVVHYAGTACDMQEIMNIARDAQIYVVEDAAQAISSFHGDSALGSIADLGCLSFHGTKNISSGEGGALLINNPRFSERAEIMLEKGTNRSQFLHGLVDKYTWVDLGSSFLPSEVTASLLRGQLEEAESINALRRNSWDRYRKALSAKNIESFATLPNLPEYATGNGHMFQILLAEDIHRSEFISAMQLEGIQAVSHYVPLHSAPAGLRYTEIRGTMTNTDIVGSRLVRLPMWSADGLPIEEISNTVFECLERLAS